MSKMGFIELNSLDRYSAILGFIKQPWKLNLNKSARKDVNANEFVNFNEANYIKGVNAVFIKEHRGGTLLTTETRVVTTGPYAEKIQAVLVFALNLLVEL